MNLTSEQLDSRNAGQLVKELLKRRLGYVPEWTPTQNGADVALIQAAARYWQAIIQRLNQAPLKNKLAWPIYKWCGVSFRDLFLKG